MNRMKSGDPYVKLWAFTRTDMAATGDAVLDALTEDPDLAPQKFGLWEPHKADLEQDATKRQADYSEIQKIYLDAAPLVFIAYLGASAGWRSNVDGFFIDGLSYYRFEDVKINK